MVKGMSCFAPIFEEQEDIARGKTILVMKRIFHCSQDTILVSSLPKDKGINMAVLSSKGLNNRTQTTHRGVWDFGKQIEKNGKKALVLVLASSEDAEYANSGNKPSGKKNEHYLLFIREAMYNEFKNSKEKEKDIYDDDASCDGVVDDDSAANEMNDSSMFPGFIAFALWGPIMPENMEDLYKAEAFFSTDKVVSTKKGKSDGRDSIRKEGKFEADTI